MPRALQASLVQDSVLAQLKSSRELFEIIAELGDITQQLSNSRETEKLRSKLENIMMRLLEIGKNLSDVAANTGDKVFESVRAS